MSGSPDEPDALVGVVLDGRYQVLAGIGRGGMGRVYRGARVGIDRPVAIKVLDPLGQTSATDRARFAREAMTAGKLDHPNCVAVVDYGVAPAEDGGEGTPYLVMDYVDGRSLSSEIDRTGAMPVKRAFHITRHILRALRHAHGLGLVHRDLTPRNVLLVERDGDPDFARLLDFGLARLMASFTDPGAAQITSTGIVCGTPRYMAPEQGLGKPLDERVDLYALSVLLYEMLTGAPPFSADEPIQVVMMHVSAPVPAMADRLGPGVVPAAVEALVRRGLAKEPDQRPRDAEAFLAELDACEATLAAAPTPPAPSLTPPSLPTVPLAAVPAPGAASSGAGDGLTGLATAPTMIGPVAGPSPRPRWPWLAGGGAVAAVVAMVALGATDDPAPAAPGPRAGATTTSASSKDGGKAGTRPSSKPTTPTPPDPPAPATAPADAVTGPVTLPDPDPTPPDPPSPAGAGSAVAAPAPWAVGLAAAVDQTRARRYGAAEDQLVALIKRYPEAAPLQVALGNVYLGRNWPEPALKAYRAALRRDPALRGDRAVVSAAISLLDSTSRWWDAARFLERDAGAPALPLLEEAGRSHKVRVIRTRAAQIAAKLR